MCMVSNVNKTTCNLFYLKIVGKIGVHMLSKMYLKQNKTKLYLPTIETGINSCVTPAWFSAMQL